MIEREPTFFGERVKKLNQEERIAGRLLMHQLRERGGTLRLAAKRIRNELCYVFNGERRKRDLLHVRSRAPDRFELAHQRMGRSDFVVPVSADQHQVLHACCSEQILEQIERRRVEPLQVVEEERQRMFQPREHADEPPEHQLKTPSRVLGKEIRNRRLVSDDQLQFRDEVDHEPSVRAERLEKRGAPGRQVGLALRQKATGEALESLSERRIGDVALVLIELARCKQASRRNEHLVQLVYDGGFSNARISCNEHQLPSAALDDAVEGGEQLLDLALSPVEFLGNQKPVWPVLLAQRERVDPALGLPLSQAAAKISLQAGCSLIPVLSGLGEQLHDNF